MLRSGFSANELLVSVVITGSVGTMAIPQLVQNKEESFVKIEMATASMAAKSLNSIHYVQLMQKGDYDWNGDGIIDNTAHDLSNDGYPWDLSNDDDDLGTLMARGTHSGFIEQTTLQKEGKTSYKIYTAIASDPHDGVPIGVKDTYREPDKNDFWVYIPQTEQGCHLLSDYSKPKTIVSGDFVLIDIRGETQADFSTKNLGINFQITCT